MKEADTMLKEKMKVIAVIPARMTSTRFPGKPLAKILGIPMVEHVYQRVALCPLIEKVIVATCDEEIYSAVQSFDGNAVMTSDSHERSVDRVAEAVESIEGEIVINVQGDEPLVRPDIIEALLSPMFKDESIQCANLITEIDDEDYNSPNEVKVVCEINGDILYYSREPIPSLRKAGSGDFIKLKQIGIIGFRKEFLNIFAKLSPTPLEAIESVDMLRALEHGYKVKMVNVAFNGIGVDVPEDIQLAEKLMLDDDLRSTYFSKGSVKS